MGIWISNFATTAAYEAAESSLATPHVSLTQDNMGIHYKPYVPPTILVTTYNVTGTSSPTKIGYNAYTSGFSAIEIDGVELPSVVSAYTFSTTGEHTVKYTLADPISIGTYAFKGCGNLKSVNIPNSVTSIGQNAFNGCYSLTRIDIPNSVTSIGNRAFADCRNLRHITVDSNNNVYDSRNNCNAIIETSTDKLIQGCEFTVIPNTVTSIGSYAFYYCINLKSINIPDSVTTIGTYAFKGCSKLESCTIGSGVTIIGNSAFEDCDDLTSIDIPNSVTSIGNSAFTECWGLESCTIGSGVTSIGNDAFYDCTGLTSITVDSNNVVYDSRNNCKAIIETNTNTLIVGCQNTVIPNSVTSIGDWAFNSCSNLTSITIPNSVTSIGDETFGDCDGLESCTIGSGVTSIGNSAFYYCESLTSITIPSGVTSIGEGAFAECSSLISITVEAIAPPTLGGSEVFDGTNSCPIYVPSGSVDTYKAASGWSRYARRIQAIP